MCDGALSWSEPGTLGKPNTLCTAPSVIAYPPQLRTGTRGSCGHRKALWDTRMQEEQKTINVSEKRAKHQKAHGCATVACEVMSEAPEARSYTTAASRRTRNGTETGSQRKESAKWQRLRRGWEGNVIVVALSLGSVGACARLLCIGAKVT